MQSSNSDKNKRGMSLQNNLEGIISLCKDLNYIESYQKDYEIGAPNYKNTSQFKAPYLLTFKDHSQWAIYTTTSLRDRVKQQQWDSYFLKMFNKNISKALLVYPDGIIEDELKKFLAKNKKIQEKEEFSSLDILLSQEEFFNLIEQNALASFNQFSQNDRKGKNFEDRVAAVLSNTSNLEKWIHQDPMLEGLHYHLFEKIVTAFELDRDQVLFIEAFADPAIIGHLPSGGLAKTDVLTTVSYKDRTTKYFTISCKRSSNSSVSVHQYSADSFADVLDPNNNELRRVLNEFQRCGNARDMDPSDAKALAQLIHPHIFKLCMWALGGFGGEGDSEKQWAKYLLIYDNDNDYSMHSVNEFAKALCENAKEVRAFGTPFSWTYQGKRGTNIQLKSPLKLSTASSLAD